MRYLPKNDLRGRQTDTLKTKTNAKHAEKETEHKCLQQKKKRKRRPRKWLNTKACGKIITRDKSTQMQELNEKWLP